MIIKVAKATKNFIESALSDMCEGLSVVSHTITPLDRENLETQQFLITVIAMPETKPEVPNKPEAQPEKTTQTKPQPSSTRNDPRQKQIRQ